MGQRTWIKIYCDKWLTGTLREETSELRGIWTDVLVLAGNLTYGDVGQISLPNNVALTDEQIAGILNINPKIWRKGKGKLLKTERINIDNGVIYINNWSKYQSDYIRQKPHRSPEFSRIKNHIKKRDNFTCQECGKSESELSIPLCIHHIDNNPANNNPMNLITLCITCHSALYKMAVHPNQEKERKLQEEKFRTKVQDKSSRESSGAKCCGEGEGEREGERDKDLKDKHSVDSKKTKSTGQTPSPPKKPKPNPQIKELFDYWEFKFNNLYNTPPIFKFGRDGKILKDLLKYSDNHNKVPDDCKILLVAMCMDDYLNEQDKREPTYKNPTIPGFYAAFEKLISEINWDDPGWERMRKEYGNERMEIEKRKANLARLN